MAKAQRKEKKIFVLDTSVIIYEHNSIMNFAEHDVGIPITVLEELDQFKKVTIPKILKLVNSPDC